MEFPVVKRFMFAVFALVLAGCQTTNGVAPQDAPSEAAQEHASATPQKAPQTTEPTVDVEHAQSLLSPDERLVSLDIPEGESKALNNRRIVGYESESYAVAVPAGASLHVEMASDSTAAYYNIHDVKDQSGAAIHRGELDGAVALIEVREPGTYLIRPFLVRAAARRGETATYSMEVSVGQASEAKAEEGRTSGTPPEREQLAKVASPASMQPAGETNATAPYTTVDYDATTLLRCEIRKTADMGKPVTHSQTCSAGIRRGEGGVAEIRIMKPDSVERVLRYRNGDWTTDDGRLTWGKEEDSWYIGIDDCEFYIIPEAAVYGG